MSDKSPEGFDEPNYTQTPNEFFDEILPCITSLSELKVTLTIIRKTFGWHVQEAGLSFEALARFSGLSRQSVIAGVGKGMKRGTIGRRPDNSSFLYFLVVKILDQSKKLTGQDSRPETVKNLDPLLKEKKKTLLVLRTRRGRVAAGSRRRFRIIEQAWPTSSSVAGPSPTPKRRAARSSGFSASTPSNNVVPASTRCSETTGARRL